MGLAIDRDRFEEEEYAVFSERLEQCLGALRELLERSDFGVGAPSIGAELEMSLVDAGCRPLPLNMEILRETLDARMTVELNRFNLESNLRHTPLLGDPFAFLGHELEDAVAELGRAASLHGGRVAMFGILPTLAEEDLQSSAMTDTPRFRALSWALQRARHEPFRVKIDGDDPLVITCDDVTFEGAATSFQLHLRVDPSDFNRVFNAVQLATAPALAVAGNSPTFLGHLLWDETRVALFKQAVDDRPPERGPNRRPPRVGFGRDWIQGGAFELLADAVAEFPVLLPVLAPEDPIGCLRAGGLPQLEEIRLHQGTVWHWNRPVYDSTAGGHLRIELRALPSGPTVGDMLANAAFLVGLGLGLAADMEEIACRFPFEEAHRNFYRAAQSGLAAPLRWPGESAAHSARDLVPRLLPVAERGLMAAGVSRDDAAGHLAVIEARCAAGTTGAVWQRRALARCEARSNRRDALVETTEHYLARSREGGPVHDWSLPG